MSVTPQGGDGGLTIIWNLDLAVGKEGVIYKLKRVVLTSRLLLLRIPHQFDSHFPALPCLQLEGPDNHMISSPHQSTFIAELWDEPGCFRRIIKDITSVYMRSSRNFLC